MKWTLLTHCAGCRCIKSSRYRARYSPYRPTGLYVQEDPHNFDKAFEDEILSQLLYQLESNYLHYWVIIEILYYRKRFLLLCKRDAFVHFSTMARSWRPRAPLSIIVFYRLTTSTGNDEATRAPHPRDEHVFSTSCDDQGAYRSSLPPPNVNKPVRPIS